jgi:hypothetical protein
MMFLVPLSLRAVDLPPTYEKDIRPLFRKHCQSCHNPDRPRGELDLSSYGAAMTGGTSGKVLVAGKPDESLVYTASAHLEEPKMPPGKARIPQTDLDIIKKWIEAGLKEKAVATVTPPVEVAKVGGLTTPQPMRRPGAITALAASPTTPLAAFPGHKQVLLWDLVAGKLLGALAFDEGEVHCLRFSSDGKILLVGGGVGGQSGQVIGFDTSTWKRAFEVGDETDVVLACDISPDKERVVLGGPTRVVKVYAVADGKLLHTFRKPTDWVLTTAFSPEGLLLAAGDRFGGLFVWEAKSGKEFAVLRGHTKAVTSLAWRADSDALLTGSEDGTVRVWDMHQQTESAKWMAHEEGVLDVQWHTSGTLVTAGRDQRVKMWEPNGKLLAASEPSSDHVMRLAIISSGKEILAGDWSGELRVWSADGKPKATINRPLLEQAAPTTAVLPDAPPSLVAVPPTNEPRRSLSVEEAQRAVETAMKDLHAAQTAHNQAKKMLALQAARTGLAQLRLALALAPDNPALPKAIAAAEEAVKTLESDAIKF